MRDKNEIQIVPRWNEIDSTLEVHHSIYWVWFEEARLNFLKKILDITYDDLRQSPFYLQVVQCDCKFLKTVYIESELAVAARLKITDKPFIDFEYHIWDSNKNTLFTKANTRQAIVSKDFEVQLTMPEVLQEAISKSYDQSPFAFFYAD
ncbi:thioesterase family protein [Muricauda sp. MAR_2010_75]|uniref:acyl-CoA thioesterase n=1 Tax=Allomuricauda sp. MAR_2010_75 TaxID=1250232 RepID=UPI00068A93AB|nr:acyl-CoA thioesterase [Muricauda sp. MAR_2010_75]